MFQNVLDRRIKFPHDLDKDAANLIDRLLDYIPENRLGMKSSNPFEGYNEIKQHPFFSDVDWAGVESRSLKPPCFDLFTGTNTDSDESSKRDDSNNKKKQGAPADEDLRNTLDHCCQHRANDFGKKHWEGEVRVRRKIFLQRRRHMVLLQDGRVILLSRGHIKSEY